MIQAKETTRNDDGGKVLKEFFLASLNLDFSKFVQFNKAYEGQSW